MEENCFFLLSHSICMAGFLLELAFSGGTLYFGELGGESVKSYSIRSGQLKTAINGYGRIRDVFIEGEAMYFVMNNRDGRAVRFKKDDKLYKLNLNDISDSR
ncbi:hypothetical protein J9317_10580 [Metabacillus sp. KIGAM252]|uniref:Uncharacterized protein n=1 Tax=Metabacillus flavus TaxID=2823519 RepID=A0ABS5LEN3_9BACI|nr:hypothetical protein [Metabacillus flavus]MBS2969208.1 hypothetical protein [Metabacillus flavus]